MGAADFNPGFSFDAGDLEEPTQAPWEFAGALKMARQDGMPADTIDDKINRRLQARQQRGGKARQAAAAGRKRRRGDAASSDDESDDAGSDDDEQPGSSGGGSSDEELSDSEQQQLQLGGDADDSDMSDGDDDAPLPGELDDDDDDDDDDGAAGDSDDDSGSDGEAGGAAAKQQQQRGRGGKQAQAASGGTAAAAAARRAAAEAVAANGAGSSGSGDDSDAGSEEEEDADAEEQQQQGKQQGKQKQQQQQQQQQRGKAATAGKAGAGGGKAGGFYAETQRGVQQGAALSFQDLNLSRPLLRAVAALGYTTPTPIQAACIPLALAGRDVCGSAQTGSGKTAAFALPILERLLYRPRQVAATYVLILAPARELAAQIHSMITKLAQFTDVDAALVVGGLSLPAQAAVLRSGPAIVVATPGRLIDHVRNSQDFGLEDLAVLVLDEADRLLEMGFKEELRELLRLAPKQRQTMLFSATFSDDVQQLVALSLKQPVRLAADPAAMAPKTLRQEIVRLKGAAGASKEAVLLALVSRSFSAGRTIVFCKTKQRAHRLKILFGLCQLPPAAELHGDMTQAARLESLEAFRQGSVGFLLATDVAARGLDILGVQVVLNYDAPRSLETYLHRVGRTARAGAGGVAVTLVGDDDRLLVKEVVRKGKVDLQQRMVPAQAVSRWQARVEAAEPDVERVLGEEREEAALRKAEMEANKAANLLEHEANIFSRPARTWFQTEREKKALAAAAAAAAEGRTLLEEPGSAGGAGAGAGSSKAAKAAAKQDKRNAKLKERRAAEAAAGARRKPVPALQAETEGFSKAIRGVKSKARSLVQAGVPAKVAQKMAAKAVTGVSTSHEKKKRKTGDSGGGGGSLFSGDGISKPGGSSGGSSGGGSRGDAKGGAKGGGKAGLSRTELNRLKRGGKSKASFKSKKKFKRR